MHPIEIIKVSLTLYLLLLLLLLLLISYDTLFLDWVRHNNSWCTLNGRQFLSGEVGVVQTFEQCRAQCDQTKGCKAIELWHAYNWNCYWCKNPDLIAPYTYTNDLAYPPFVWVKTSKYSVFFAIEPLLLFTMLITKNNAFPRMEKTSLQLVYNSRADAFEWRSWCGTNVQRVRCPVWPNRRMQRDWIVARL